jgi:hypothetical protein
MVRPWLSTGEQVSFLLDGTAQMKFYSYLPDDIPALAPAHPALAQVSSLKTPQGFGRRGGFFHW